MYAENSRGVHRVYAIDIRYKTRLGQVFPLKIPNKAEPELGSEKYYSFFALGMESRHQYLLGKKDSLYVVTHY